MNDYKSTYMYLANTAILNIQIFSRRYYLWVSDYGFLLRLVNTFTTDTDEHYQMSYDAKTFKNLAYCTHVFYAYSQIIIYVYCRLARLTGTF